MLHIKMRGSLVLYCILLLGACSATALPAVEGIVESTGNDTIKVQLSSVGVVWSQELLTDSESGFHRLHMSDWVMPKTARFTLRIKDRGNRVVLEVPSAVLAQRASYWTKYLAGTYSLIEIVNHAVSQDELKLRIAEIAIERKGARVLSIQDQVNPKDRPLYYYSDDLEMMKVARSVAKLRFEKDKVLLTCTGFLVSKDLLLTNQHCFDTADGCASAVVMFGYQEDADHNLQAVEEVRCEEIKDSDISLDFTLMKVSDAPGMRWGTLRWSSSLPRSSAPMYVVQHPGGQPKRVALEGCAIKTPSAVGHQADQVTDIGHTCDTENGSSGSPVLSLEHRVVGLHHLGFSLNDRRWLKENRAVKASLIQARIAQFIE